MNDLKIISAGRSSPEVAALEWAFANGVKHGGWCPRGMTVVGEALLSRLKLKYAPSPNPLQSEEWNVWDSDGVINLTFDTGCPHSSDILRALAKKHAKPLLYIAASHASAAVHIRSFVQAKQIASLYVMCSHIVDDEKDLTSVLPHILNEAFTASSAASRLGDLTQQGPAAVVTENPGGNQPRQFNGDIVAQPDEDEAIQQKYISLYRSWERSKPPPSSGKPSALPSHDTRDGADEFHLDSAWSCLFDNRPFDAVVYVECISDGMRQHPSVFLIARCVYLATQQWSKLEAAAQDYSQCRPGDSDGWLLWAIALQKTGRSMEAYQLLMSVKDRFPSVFGFPYNLACFACQLGHIEEAWSWVLKAYELSTLQEFKRWLLTDDDLEPLRERIIELSQRRLI